MISLAPLVDPAPALTSEEITRYGRHLIIPQIGLLGQRRLKNARVLVIGAGGLGSPILMYLAAGGIGTLGIVDNDIVEESNLQRQVIHTMSDLGRPKVDSAKDALQAINPLTCVDTYYMRLTNENAISLFSRYDLILDATDNFPTRYLINDAAILAAKPYIWGSVSQFEGQAAVFWEAAPYGYAINYRDLYPTPPLAPVSSSPIGVFGALCASIGSIMATETIKLLTGTGKLLLGRVLIYNALEMSYHTITICKDPTAEPITHLIDYSAFCSRANQESE